MARERDSVGKLVRDKIPDMIRASGRTPHVRTLSTAEYRTALLDKLREEVAELIAAATRDAVIEEAADVLEVLTAIAAEHGATLDTIVGVTRSKLAERGGFDMRLSLDAIDSASP
jgi:predicted house-cleaning noncanonical NTP pyrophosphatase (MazG superfamily)